MEAVGSSVKSWVELDNEEKALRGRIAEIKKLKEEMNGSILTFMRDNKVDNFNLEESGSMTRSTRTTRPPLKRSELRTQLLLFFPDQQEKVAEFLRFIEGEPKEKEVITRRVPRKPKA